MDIAKKASQFAKAVYNAAAHPEQHAPVQHHADHPSQQLLEQQQQQQSQLSPHFQQSTHQQFGVPQQNAMFNAQSTQSGQVAIPPPYGKPNYEGPSTSMGTPVVPSMTPSMIPSTGLSPYFSSPPQQSQHFGQFGTIQGGQPQGQWAQTPPATWPSTMQNPMGTSPSPALSMQQPLMPTHVGQQNVFPQGNFTPGMHSVSPLPPNATPVPPQHLNQVPFSPISPSTSTPQMNMPPPSMVNPTSYPSTVHELPVNELASTSFIAELPAEHAAPIIELPADVPTNFTPNSLGQPGHIGHISSPPPPLLAASADASIHKLEQPKPVHPDQTPQATAQQIATMTPVSPPPFSPPTSYQQAGLASQQHHYPGQPQYGHPSQQMHSMAAGAQQQMPHMHGMMYPSGTNMHMSSPSDLAAASLQMQQASYQPGMYSALPNGAQAGAPNASAAHVQQRQQLLNQQQMLLQQQLAAQAGHNSGMSQNPGL